MMTTANAITDSSGAMLWMRNTSGSMKAGRLETKAESIWDTTIRVIEKKSLVQLLGRQHFDLLVRHLVDDLGYALNKSCRFGSSGTVREISIENNVFRSNSYQIFSRKT